MPYDGYKADPLPGRASVEALIEQSNRGAFPSRAAEDFARAQRVDAERKALRAAHLPPKPSLNPVNPDDDSNDGNSGATRSLFLRPQSEPERPLNSGAHAFSSRPDPFAPRIVNQVPFPNLSPLLPQGASGPASPAPSVVDEPSTPPLNPVQLQLNAWREARVLRQAAEQAAVLSDKPSRVRGLSR